MKTLLIYSEDGCPWCTKMKEQLKGRLGIRHIVRDIERYD